MQGAGDELLAGAGLAEEQDGRVGGRDLLDLAQHPAERGARADDLSKPVHVAHLPLQHHVLRLEPVLELLTSRRLPCSAAFASSSSVTSVSTTTAPSPPPWARRSRDSGGDDRGIRYR